MRTKQRSVVGLMTGLLALSAFPTSAYTESRSDCDNSRGAQAVDLSSPADQPFLDAMKKLRITTIIRYYDNADETIRGKTLRRPERDLILKNGFKIAVVFQHHNDNFSTFTPARGQADGNRSLVLAKENLQPSGSAIYFGVDGAWKDPDEIAAVKAYFDAVKARLMGSGYRVGIYGSGLMCRETISAGLAELCWLAKPRFWPEYAEFKLTNKWDLLQLSARKGQTCLNHSVDFDNSGRLGANFGQFGF